MERLGRHVVEICERGGLPWLYVGHLYLGLAAHWRGDWETAERELRLADQLEAPGAIGGQSAAHLALHLARVGRGDDADAAIGDARAMLANAGFAVEYLELRDAEGLGPAVPGRPARLLVAARIGGTRLIDNVAVSAT